MSTLDPQSIRDVIDRVIAKSREERGFPPLSDAEVEAKRLTDIATEIRARVY